MTESQPRLAEALSAARHRIVGDLNLVHSMLGMALRRTTDHGAADLLQATRSRVRTISLAHTLAAKNGARSGRVDGLALLSEVVLGANQTHRRAGVQAELSGQHVRVTFDRAVAIGLIVGELVDNSLRHGFRDGRSGAIRVTLRGEKKGNASLRVSDDGVGFGEERYQSDTLGFTMVRLLAEQIAADVSLKTAEGCGSEFSLRFARGVGEDGWHGF
jgi:two-component sensor histidine kinase